MSIFSWRYYRGPDRNNRFMQEVVGFAAQFWSRGHLDGRTIGINRAVALVAATELTGTALFELVGANGQKLTVFQNKYGGRNRGLVYPPFSVLLEECRHQNRNFLSKCSR